MNQSINCTFKEINTGFTIYIKLKSNVKLSEIKNIINSKISNAFGIDYNLYNILYIDLDHNSSKTNIVPIDVNLNELLLNISSKAFYIESHVPILNLSNCSICNSNCICNACEYWKCEHHFKFCNNCVNNWKLTCNSNNIKPHCPLCRNLL